MAFLIFVETLFELLLIVSTAVSVCPNFSFNDVVCSLITAASFFDAVTLSLILSCVSFCFVSSFVVNASSIFLAFISSNNSFSLSRPSSVNGAKNPFSSLTCSLASPLASIAILARLILPTLLATPILSTNLFISFTPEMAKFMTDLISSPKSSPIVLARVSIVSCKVDNFPFKVSACAVAPPAKMAPSLVKFINA